MDYLLWWWWFDLDESFLFPVWVFNDHQTVLMWLLRENWWWLPLTLGGWIPVCMPGLWNLRFSLSPDVIVSSSASISSACPFSLHSDGSGLVGMLTLEGRSKKRSLRESSQASKTCSEPPLTDLGRARFAEFISSISAAALQTCAKAGTVGWEAPGELPKPTGRLRVQ